MLSPFLVKLVKRDTNLLKYLINGQKNRIELVRLPISLKVGGLEHSLETVRVSFCMSPIDKSCVMNIEDSLMSGSYQEIDFFGATYNC